MATGGQGLKAFVSETEIEEKKKKRQEEWEKVRKPEDPEECPEEEYDPRSLFEKLQEQKDTKQEQFEEQFKFKNMVRGLDDEESAFLEKVSQKQMEMEMSKQKEEKELMDQFKNRVVSVDEPSQSKPEKAKTVTSSGGSRQASSGGSRQASLLAGAVKRKRKTSDEAEPLVKKPDMTASTKDDVAADTEGAVSERLQKPASQDGLPGQNGVKCLGILPGIGFYAHSSDDSSNSDSSDSDLVETIGVLNHGGKKGR